MDPRPRGSARVLDARAMRGRLDVGAGPFDEEGVGGALLIYLLGRERSPHMGYEAATHPQFYRARKHNPKIRI